MHEADDEYGKPKEGLDIKDITIPTPDGTTVEARLYKPSGASDHLLPLYIHLRPGGWHLGTVESEEPFCAWLCATINQQRKPVAVLHVSYRCTPEHHYPTQLDDVCAALAYLTKGSHAAGELGVDANRIILSGTSSGAHLSIGSMLRADADLKKRVKGLILTCTPTVHIDLFPFELLRSKEGSSYAQEANDVMLGLERGRIFWGLYLGAGGEDEAEVNRRKAEDVNSPLLAPDGLFGTSWPATTVHVAGMDTARDEGFLFEEKLKRTGVDTRLHVYAGFPHAFNMLPQLEESKRWRDTLLGDVAWLLERN